MKDVVICPTCGHSNSLSAYRCAVCGVELASATVETIASSHDTILFHSKTAAEVDGVDIRTELKAGEVAFYLIGATKFIRFIYTKPILLGRGIRGTSSALHYVDLTGYNAHSYGVSRHHALVQQVETEYYITDLKSSNGIVVNGQRIVPNRAFPLENGSKVILGKFGVIFEYG